MTTGLFQIGGMCVYWLCSMLVLDGDMFIFMYVGGMFVMILQWVEDEGESRGKDLSY